MKLKSYAKLNLFLDVLFKRKDGYHEIQTLFERVSLSDTLTLTPRARAIRVRSNAKNLSTGPANLAYRAAKLLRDRYHVKSGVDIYIDKRIPISAGLGGGSSNASAVLLGLNRLWKLGLTRRQLMDAAAVLGSDTAFFVLNVPRALGSGRGEKLVPLRHPRFKFWYCIVKPSFGISTKAAYRTLERRGRARLTPRRANVKILLHSIQKGRSEVLFELLTNSLEDTLNKRVTEIQDLKWMLLKKGALGALMSGSGSAVFGVFSSEKKAKTAANFLKKINKTWKVFVASTV